MSASADVEREIHLEYASQLVADFFQGVAVDMWLEALPPEHTAREADALAQALAVPLGAEILDVPCGAAGCRSRSHSAVTR